jgi:cytochrome P450
VHQWSVLRDPINFHSPNSFIPERWLKDAAIKDRLETSLPFSYGPRGCLGRKCVSSVLSLHHPKSPTLTTLLPHSLAYLEMRMVLAKLMWAYDITWFNGADVVWERDTKGYTLWEKPELRVELSLHPGTTANI